MKKSPWLFAALFWLPSHSFASDAGTTSLNFLKIGLGAREIGMGGTGVAAADDFGASLYNPAALGGVGRQEFSFLHTQWLQGVTYEYLGYAHPTQNYGTFAGGAHYLTWGGIQGYDAQGTQTSTLSLYDVALNGSWGMELRPGLSFGSTIKYVQETLDTVTGRTAALDLGMAYRPAEGAWAQHFKYGLAFTNLGPGIKFIQDTEPLPWNIGGGVAYKAYQDALTVALELHKPSDNSLYASIGSEMWINNSVALRIGYKSGEDLGNGLNAGFGIKIRDSQIDYALTNFGSLGYTHRIQISIRFGGPVQALYERGLDHMRNGEYEQAIIDFDKVLMLKPDHPKALQHLQECHEKLLEQDKTN